MSKEAMKLALEAAYLAGFNASGEGYNGEYPFGDKNQNPEADAVWVKDRDNTIREALAEQPAQKRPQNCGTGYCSCIECVMEPAQQEPVAYMDICEKNQMSGLRYWSEPDNRHEVPLYTSPPAQRKPLTDEEIWKFWWSRPEVPDGEDDSMEAEFVAAVRRVLAAQGIKGDA